MTSIEFLVEEPSAEEALRHIVPRILIRQAQFNIRNFGSKHRLLKALPDRLRAYADRIAGGEDVRVVVMIDCDTDECRAIKTRLEQLSKESGLYTKTRPNAHGRFSVLNRIVVVELESWFIGDVEALRKAFSKLPPLSAKANPFRNPDNGGTWEALHKLLKRHGIYRNSYPKIEAARKIAPLLNIDANRSTSFRCFVTGVTALARADSYMKA